MSPISKGQKTSDLTGVWNIFRVWGETEAFEQRSSKNRMTLWGNKSIILTTELDLKNCKC